MTGRPPRAKRAAERSKLGSGPRRAFAEERRVARHEVGARASGAVDAPGGVFPRRLVEEAPVEIAGAPLEVEMHRRTELTAHEVDRIVETLDRAHLRRADGRGPSHAQRTVDRPRDRTEHRRERTQG